MGVVWHGFGISNNEEIKIYDDYSLSKFDADWA